MTKEQKLLIEYSSLIGYTDGMLDTLIKYWDLPKELIDNLQNSLEEVRGHRKKLDGYFEDL